jgi:hypothetical protein
MYKGSFPDDEEYETGTLSVVYNNEIVFQIGTDSVFKPSGKSYKIQYYDYLLKKVKLSPWMDELTTVVDVIQNKEICDDVQKKIDAQKRLASNIDLGDYK